MTSLPKIGAMIRCVGPSFEAGAVTYNGHTNIDLPRRTADGEIMPDTFDSYHLKRVGGKWIYDLVPIGGQCEHCSKPIGGERHSKVYLGEPHGPLDARIVHTECVPAFRAANRGDLDSIEDIDHSGDLGPA